MGSTIQRFPKFSLLKLSPIPLALRVVPLIRSGSPPGVVHHHMCGGVAIDDQPVPRAGGLIDRSAVDVAPGDRDAAVDLLLNQLEISVLLQNSL